MSKKKPKAIPGTFDLNIPRVEVSCTHIYLTDDTLVGHRLFEYHLPLLNENAFRVMAVSKVAQEWTGLYSSRAGAIAAAIRMSIPIFLGIWDKGSEPVFQRADGLRVELSTIERYSGSGVEELFQARVFSDRDERFTPLCKSRETALEEVEVLVGKVAR